MLVRIRPLPVIQHGLQVGAGVHQTEHIRVITRQAVVGFQLGAIKSIGLFECSIAQRIPIAQPAPQRRVEQGAEYHSHPPALVFGPTEQRVTIVQRRRVALLALAGFSRGEGIVTAKSKHVPGQVLVSVDNEGFVHIRYTF